jgi:ABC-type microcin C transport system duplicated ATPase subunit YejF
MTEGRIVEYGDTIDVFQRPQAEYTQRLLANTPTVENALGSSSAN